MSDSTLVAALRPSIRAGLVAGLAITVARFLRQPPFPLYPLVAVVIVTDLSPSQTREHGDYPCSYAWYRAVETVLGIGLAVQVRLVPPLRPLDAPTREGS